MLCKSDLVVVSALFIMVKRHIHIQKQHNPCLIQLMQPDLFVRNIFCETVVLSTEQDVFILMLEFDGEFSMKIPHLSMLLYTFHHSETAMS